MCYNKIKTNLFLKNVIKIKLFKIIKQNKQTNKRKTKGEKTKQNFFANFQTQTILETFWDNSEILKIFP